MSLDVSVDTSVMDDLMKNLAPRLDEWLRLVATEMVADIKASFGVSPPGRRYKRGRHYHVASRPGYPPNVDLGTLRASIRWRKDGPLAIVITDGVDYGVYLELGPGSDRRPFMSPVFEEWRKKIVDHARSFGLVLGV